MKNWLLLAMACLFFACDDQAAAEKITALESDLAKAKTTIDSLQAMSVPEYTPGLCHTVFFWLREDLSADDRSAFIAGVRSLADVPTVKNLLMGPPAPTEARDVVDNTYSYALLVQFDGVEGQNAYQTDPIHLKFVDDHKDKWTKVVVYDNIVAE